MFVLLPGELRLAPHVPSPGYHAVRLLLLLLLSLLIFLLLLYCRLQTLALWKFSRYLILTALPFKLCNDASQFVAPTFLSLLLGVVSSGQPSSLGYMYATLMLALLITGTLCDNQHFQRVMRAGETVVVHFQFPLLTLCGNFLAKLQYMYATLQYMYAVLRCMYALL